MAQQTELAVSPRDLTGKAAKRLRNAGIIPANIFGHKEPSQAVQLEALAFEALRRAHRATGIIALRLPGEGVQTALVRHVQRDPRSNKIVHIDFFRVSLTERINVKVPLHVVGEAPAVKLEGGVLLHLLDALEVECAAGEIVENVDVDVSSLAHIDDIIHAKEVTLPANFTLVTDPEEGVVKVAATRAEVTEEAASAAEIASEAAAPAASETPEA